MRVLAGRTTWLRAAALALALLAVAADGSAASAPHPHQGAAHRRRAPVPAGFFGVVPNVPFESGDWARLGALRLSDRLQVSWEGVEPQRGQFEWAGLDAALGEAAAHGVQVLPELYGSPNWVAPAPSRPPLGKAQRADWNEFLRALVGRYGPGGEFWKGQARPQPIHRWQIWNEPNFPLYWQPRPSASDYVHLLQTSSKAIHAVDPKALVIAAGLAPVEHEPPPWRFLQEMYSVRGARSAFDAAALHPYANTLEGLTYSVESARRVMAQAGDARKPLFVSELGVSSAGGSPFDVGLQGQAHFLEVAFDKLAKERRRWRIGGVYWFTWADSTGESPGCTFCDNSGLFGIHGEPKPAWAALEGVVARWLR